MKKIILYSALAAISFTSCDQEGIDTFELNESRIYFQEQNYTGSDGSAGYSTAMNFSYVGYSLDYQSVVFGGTVKIMGEVKDYDRPIKVMIDEENTTMPSEGSYEVNFDTLRIKAGENSCKVNVRFLRPKRLNKGEDTLTLKLIPNEHFQVLEEYKASNNWQNTTAQKIDGTRYQFRISEIYTQPGAWGQYAGTYFGTWTITKFVYINSFFGFSTDDWTYHNGASSKITQARMPFFAKELQKELQKMADAGTPVRDEDGLPMQLPSPYSVNYDAVNQ